MPTEFTDDDAVWITAHVAKVVAALRPALAGHAGRFPDHARLMARLQSAAEMVIAQGRKSLSPIDEAHNELCVALGILESDLGVTSLRYEPPLSGTKKSIDFVATYADAPPFYVDVKTIAPKRVDRWEQFETAEREGHFPECVSYTLDEQWLGGELFHNAFAARWGAGDCAGHIEILNKMHEGIAPTETPYLYQLLELACPLPLELEARKQASWTKPGDRPTGWEAVTLGMLWFREKKYTEALEVLRQPMSETTLVPPTAARAIAAMAHWNLQTSAHKDEARRLLREADERFNQTVIIPGEGMYPPWFPSCVMIEMVIKEADTLIDPDVTNAPHVAALPKEGWPTK